MAHRLINDNALEIRQSILDPDSENVLLVDWVKMDALMRKNRVASPAWPYDFQIPEIGSTVFIDSRIATVVDFGIIRVDDNFERCVWVRFQDGVFLKAAGKNIKVVSKEELEAEKTKREELKKKLIESSKKIEKMQSERKGSSKQSQLNTRLLDIARKMELAVDEKSGFYKITGKKKGRALYVGKSGGRIDVNGFRFEDPTVEQISEEEARAKHLGKVTGHFNFSVGEDAITESFKKALENL